MRIKKSIGFTNGCFDILHAGHVELFRKAKKQCDFLIVALNSDKSVRLIKGKNRPINNIKNRIKVIKSVRYIDKVIVFHEKDPLTIIKKIKPDIIFKGSDYKILRKDELDVCKEFINIVFEKHKKIEENLVYVFIILFLSVYIFIFSIYRVIKSRIFN